jgi:hypothetical protein
MVHSLALPAQTIGFHHYCGRRSCVNGCRIDRVGEEEGMLSLRCKFEKMNSDELIWALAMWAFFLLENIKLSMIALD